MIIHTLESRFILCQSEHASGKKKKKKKEMCVHYPMHKIIRWGSMNRNQEKVRPVSNYQCLLIDSRELRISYLYYKELTFRLVFQPRQLLLVFSRHM